MVAAPQLVPANGQPEISWALAEAIASWRRVMRQRAPQVGAIDVLRNAAEELWRALEVDKTVYPAGADAAHHAVVDAMQEIAEIGGVDPDRAQQIFGEAKDAPRRPTGDSEARPSAQRQRRLVFKCLADIEPQPVRWLWPDRIPRKLVLFTGVPDAGKTLVALDIASRVTTADVWPDGSGAAAPGSVIIMTAEDGLADTIRTRSQIAGADLSRIHCLEAALNEEGKPTAFSLQDDLARLGAEVARLRDVSLIIVDPITAYLGAGKVDTHKTADVRAILAPLRDFAEQHNLTILGITHPPKTAGAAINAATGSLAFIAAARSAYLFVAEPEADRTLMLPIKNNLGPRKTGLAFRVGQRLAQLAGEGTLLPYVIWDSEPVTVTADQALAAASGGQERSALEGAVEFLRDALGNGPRDNKDVKTEAAAHGIAARTLRRAKDELGVRVEKDGFATGVWLWRLPEGGQETPKVAKPETWTPSAGLATFDGGGANFPDLPPSLDRRPGLRTLGQ